MLPLSSFPVQHDGDDVHVDRNRKLFLNDGRGRVHRRTIENSLVPSGRGRDDDGDRDHPLEHQLVVACPSVGHLELFAFDSLDLENFVLSHRRNH